MQHVDVYSVSELPSAEKGCRYLDFLGGTKNLRCFLVPYDMPRCEFFSRYSVLLDETMQPIYEKDGILVRQDASFALPGFYVLSYTKYFNSFDKLDDIIYMRSFFLIKKIRYGMRDRLNIPFIHMYYEEKTEKSCNVHYWLMPILTDNSQHTPIIYDIEIKKYLSRFSFQNEKKSILLYNNVMKDYIKEINLNQQDDDLKSKLQQK